MAPPKKADQRWLADCRARLDVAKEFRKNQQLDTTDGLWRRMIDLYRGKHFAPGMKTEDRIAVNICFSTINVIGPAVSINHPKIVVNARDNEAADAALVAEAAVNYGWIKWGVHPQFRRAVDDFLILGFGWLKVGWAFEEDEVPLSDEEYTKAFAKAVQSHEQKAAEDPYGAYVIPDDDAIAEGLPTTRIVVQRDQPFVERVSPFDVFVDAEATSLQDAKWVAQRVVRPLVDVRKDPRYKPSVREKVGADSRLKDEYRPVSDQERDKDFARCTIWEFYDLRANTVCVFAHSGDDFLVSPVENPMPFPHPFVMLRNYEVPDQFYPMGELEALEPLQHELNKTRSAMMNDRKQYRRKYLYRSSAFSKSGVSALSSDNDNEMVPVEGTIPFQDAIMPMPSQTMPPQLYEQSETIENDINHITALSEYQRGALPEIRRTATEASIIQDAANARAAHKLALVENSMAEVARKVVQVMQSFQDQDDITRITAKNGQPVWVAYSREELEGEFDFTIAAGSTQPKNDTARRQQAMQMMQALGPLAVPGGPVDIGELLRFILRFGFDIQDPERFMAKQNEQITDQMGAPPSVEGQDPNQAIEDQMLTENGPPGQGGDPMAAAALAPAVDNGLSADVGTATQIPPELLAQLAGQVGLDLPAGAVA